MSIRSSRPRRASISAMATNDSPERSSVARGTPIASPNPNGIFTSTKSSSSSSKQPARSFSSQSPQTSTSMLHATRPQRTRTDRYSLTGPAQYSSEGVREQTAELASYTFTKPGSFTETSLGPVPSTASNHSNLRTQSETQSPTRPQAQRTSDPAQTGQLPETIEETSEPASPEGSQSSTPHAPQSGLDGDKKSGLSNMFQKLSTYGSISQQRKSSESQNKNTTRQEVPEIVVKQTEEDEADEQRPLLNDRHQDPFSTSHSVKNTTKDSLYSADVENQKPFRKKQNHFRQILNEAHQKGSHAVSIATHPKQWSARSIWQHGVKEPVSLIPCVFLGLLLNVLDALSYGMILFPLGEPIFAATGADGISMFYVSCIVSQLIYSGGGSVFKGAVGSEMIEVVPFFHKMVYTIMEHTGKSNPHVVLATTITAFAMSSVLTGIVFFTLGALKLGSLVSFFPRHILIGCIGGVGFFLFVTGIEVSARLDGNLKYNMKTARALFQHDTVALWTIPLALSIFLLIIQRFNRAPYVVPAFFIIVAVVFYIVVVATTKFNVPLARDNGWIFAAPEAGVPFYNFYSYYDFGAVDWGALSACIPSMFALTFFGVLHVPINIPALAIAAEEDDLNLNRELVAHGFSNAISGLLGSIQNYLVYVNSQMFIQNGGNSRLAGFLLAAATTGVWIAGPVMIGYVPVMVVGALIFYLGIELLEEALWDPMGKMSKLEYLTVLVIVLVMGIYDFVAGILAGIVLACLNFVVQTSRKSAIRASYSGEVVESTVRRHPIQRHFLHEVGYQIYVTKLAGFLFFGSIVRVEKQARALIEEEAFNRDPIRYLIFDLAHVDGIDFSAAEAFSRMERVLARRQVKMIMSGVSKESDVGKSLRSVGLWKDDSSVRFFETLNNALEYCENELLRAFYTHKEAMDSWGCTRRGSIDMPKSEAISTSQTQPGVSEYSNVIASSPRQRYLQEAATITLEEHVSLSPKKWHSFKQPLPLILQTFQELTTQNEDFWFHAVSYFERRDYVQGTVLFSRGQEPDGFYLLESGILHAHYTLPMGQYQESIVAGTTCGELPFFSKTSRTATVVAEKDCVAWRLSKESWERMQKEWPEGATEILQVAMKLTKERFDGVVSYVLTTAG